MHPFSAVFRTWSQSAYALYYASISCWCVPIAIFWYAFVRQPPPTPRPEITPPTAEQIATDPRNHLDDTEKRAAFKALLRDGLDTHRRLLSFLGSLREKDAVVTPETFERFQKQFDHSRSDLNACIQGQFDQRFSEIEQTMNRLYLEADSIGATPAPEEVAEFRHLTYPRLKRWLGDIQAVAEESGIYE